VVKLITAAVDCGVSPGAKNLYRYLLGTLIGGHFVIPCTIKGQVPPAPQSRPTVAQFDVLRFRAVGIGSIASWNRDIEALRS
jgi:hypothetical protein